MRKLTKVNTASENINYRNVDNLRRVFPQFVKENKIDFDAVKKFFEDEEVIAGEEKYGLNWAGKSNAFKLIRTPSIGTLTPQKNESKDWEKTENIFIEGENLEVLKLLQKHYREKIKMIYIDPPYNTGKDFIYKDDYVENIPDYYEKTGQSKNGIKMTSNPESAGRYHSDWLTMMYSRLFLARNLLKENGVIFISIDDNEVANLRLIMDEIFGEENFIESIIWKKRYGGGAKEKFFVSLHEYVLIYSKNIESIMEITIPLEESSINKYYVMKDEHIDMRGPFRTHPLEATKTMGDRPNLIFPIIAPDGTKVMPKRQWLWSKEKVEEALGNNELYFIKVGSKWIVHTKQYLKNKKGEIRRGKMQSIIDDVFTQHGTNEIIKLFGNAQIFPFPKPSLFTKKLLYSSTSGSDTILDFFAGSGTTAHAVMDLNAEDEENRKWIMVQLPEATSDGSEAYKAGYKTIAEIARERIRRAGRKINKGDTGFKSFALSKSNYRQWNILTDKDDPKKLKKQMKLFLEKPLSDGYDEKSVAYEILLKEGYDLNSKVSQEKNGNFKYWQVTDGGRKLLVTFEKKITRERVQSLNLSEEDTFVCLDSALDDTTKINIRRNINIKVI
ncbi:site-specific DNA-methyltransferase [Candidatus Roizmanbacteria bacterium]|nr:site-specific DNA-methyltransferase [Candidatus Roizmanbacteria bacterium]